MKKLFMIFLVFLAQETHAGNQGACFMESQEPMDYCQFQSTVPVKQEQEKEKPKVKPVKAKAVQAAKKETKAPKQAAKKPKAAIAKAQPVREIAQEPAATPVSTEGVFQIYRFGFAGIIAIQTKGQCSTFMGSWEPQYKFNDFISAGFRLGLSVYQAEATHTVRPLIDYQLITSVFPFEDPIGLELAVGMQTFVGRGSHPLIGENIFYQFDASQNRYLERIFLGYGSLLYPGRYTHEVKAGFIIKF